MGKTTEKTKNRTKEVKNSSYKALSLLMALLLLSSVSVPVFARQDQSGALPYYIGIDDMIEVGSLTHLVVFTSHDHTGGSVPVPRELPIPGSIELYGPGDLEKEGYIFGGWQLHGTYVVYEPGEVAYFHSMETEYFLAVWIPYNSDEGWQLFNDDFIPFDLPGPAIIYPRIENQVLRYDEALTFQWEPISGATEYFVSLQNMSTVARGATPFEYINNSMDASFDIPPEYLTPGDKYRIAVGAMVNGVERWSFQYFSVQRPLNVPTINPPSENQVLPFSTVVIRWVGTPGATYVMSLRRIDNNDLLFNHFPMGTATSTSLVQNSFAPGARYRVAIGATLDGRTLWYERHFSIQGQQQQPTPTLSVSPTSWNPAAAGGSADFTITTNQHTDTVTAWSSNSSWLSVHRTSATRFTLRAQPNPHTTSRSATVTVSTAGLHRQITVTQAGAAAQVTLTVSPTSWEVPSGGGLRNFTITTNQPMHYASVWSSQTWLRVSGTGATRTMTADPNPNTTSRWAIVTVAVGTASRQIHVTQEPTSQATLTVSPTFWEPASEGGSTNFTITTNQPIANVAAWSNQSWLTVSGTGIIRTLTASENDTSAQRTATVTVSVDGQNRTITVHQNPATLPPPSLSVDESSWNPPHTASTLTVNVTSNRRWTISGATNWLTVSNVTPANQTGNGSFRLNATANTGNIARVTTITVSVDGAPIQMIDVRQAAQQQAIVYITYHNALHGVQGSVPASQRVRTDQDIDIQSNAGSLRLPGHVLLGWSRRANLSNANPDFRLGQRNVVGIQPGELRLYAHWERQAWWPNSVNVNVHLYADLLYDTSVFNTWSAYTTNLRMITSAASNAFRNTFGVHMNILTHVNPVSSAKNDCDDPGMVRPRFLCFGNGDKCRTLLEEPLNMPSACCVRHHSSGRYMIYRFGREQNVLNHPNALHLMFFAGYVCYLRPNGNHWRATGFGRMRGNVATVSSSRTNNPRDFLPIIRTAQHEWSHNYGANDRADCLTFCIMVVGNGFEDVLQTLNNVWCARCRGDINDHLNRNMRP